MYRHPTMCPPREAEPMPHREYDFDWVVIASGFSGSVSALRLSEKGYSVGVLECGRRFRDDEFAGSTWDARRYFWMPKRPNQTFIPIANRAATLLADQIGGIAQSNVTEALANIPTTAHILGGAGIAAGPERGVVDARQRVFAYRNLLVGDGAAVPANVGVNPSLTITALAEHAMSHIPAANGRSEPIRTETVPAASVRALGEGTSTRSLR